MQGRQGGGLKGHLHGMARAARAGGRSGCTQVPACRWRHRLRWAAASDKSASIMHRVPLALIKESGFLCRPSSDTCCT